MVPSDCRYLDGFPSGSSVQPIQAVFDGASDGRLDEGAEGSDVDRSIWRRVEAFGGGHARLGSIRSVCRPRKYSLAASLRAGTSVAQPTTTVASRQVSSSAARTAVALTRGADPSHRENFSKPTAVSASVIRSRTPVRSLVTSRAVSRRPRKKSAAGMVRLPDAEAASTVASSAVT